MTDYEHFLAHKKELTAALEKSILAALEGLSVDEINQISWFNNKMWQDGLTDAEIEEVLHA